MTFKISKGLAYIITLYTIQFKGTAMNRARPSFAWRVIQNYAYSLLKTNLDPMRSVKDFLMLRESETDSILEI